MSSKYEGKKFCKEAAALKVGSEQGDQIGKVFDDWATFGS